MASIHYVETFNSWTPSIKDTWEEKDLSAFISDSGDITAEILIGTSGATDIDYSCGIRTPGSTLDRRVNLHYARDSGGYNTVTMHVQLSGGKIEHNAPDGVDFFLMGYWVGAQYVELIDSFVTSGANVWTNGNLNNFGVPSGAIVELTCGQSFGNQSQGVRSVGSSIERRFLMDAGSTSPDPDNYTFWSSFLQTSGSLATVQHYAAFASDWQRFNIFGYWQSPPGDYTDLYTDDAANPPNELTWNDVNVVGLPSGSVGSFLLGHQDIFNSRIVGIRESGSSLDRKINVRKRANRRGMMSYHANALSGNIESIAENVIGTNDHFPLIGYWDNFNEAPAAPAVSVSGSFSIVTNSHAQHNTSESLPSGMSMFISGIPWASITMYLETQELAVLSATLFIKSPESLTGNNNLFISGPNLVGTSGVGQSSSGINPQLEIIGNSPSVFVSGPTITTSGMDLYLQGFTHKSTAHYIEDFRVWNADTLNVWEEKDLSAFLPNEPNIVAEIVIGTSGDTESIEYSGGIRTPGSSLDRHVNLHFARSAGGFNVVTMHVQTSGGKIEHCGTSGVNMWLLGYWVGVRYIELSDSFLASGTNSWLNTNLNTLGVPSGAIVEVISAQSFGGLSQGVRSVGNSANRRFDMDAGDNDPNPDNYTFWSSFLQTSGNLATIEHYAEFASDWQPTYVMGYWDNPPGDYTDLYQDDEANPTIDASWEEISITNIPSGAVASFLATHTSSPSSRVLGMRSPDTSLERKIEIRSTSNGRMAYSLHVPSVSGTVVSYSEDATGIEDHFALVGYWNNFNDIIPISMNNNFPLSIVGHTEHDTSGVLPSGMSMFISGIPWSSFNLYIQSIEPLSTSINLFMQAPFPFPSGGDLFIRGPHLVGTSGVGQSSSGMHPILEISGDSPSLFTVGPKLSTQSSDLFLQVAEPIASSLNLFLKVFDNRLTSHYIEDFKTWTPIIKDTWETKDLSAFVPDVSKITAEIVIGTSGNTDLDFLVGVRTPGSILDRRVNLHYARNVGGYNTVTMHVQLSGSTIEHNAPSGVDFFLMGYWIGATYVELAGSFTGVADNWQNKDLDIFGVPSGAIVELVNKQGSSFSTGYIQGVRSVGSTIERSFRMDDGDNSPTPVNYSCWTSFLQTSGINATIQWKQEWESNWQQTDVIGYWSSPPGDYTDIFQEDEANPSSNNTWENIGVSGVPSGAVASFVLGSNDNAASRFLGARSTANSLERKIEIRKTASASQRMLHSWHVNINSDITTYSEDATGSNDHFTLMGYWDNFAVSPITLVANSILYTKGLGFESGTPSLFTHGLDSIDSSGQYPSGIQFFIKGVELADFDLNIYGRDNLSTSNDLFIFGVNVFRTDLEFSTNYPSGLSLFTDGSGIIAESGQTTLFSTGNEFIDTSGDIFTKGIGAFQTSNDLFIKAPESFSSQITLYLHKPISLGSGLIGETDAVFYLSRRHHDDTTSAIERVENIDLNVAISIFGNRTFLNQSGAITTVGDGTLPNYNDMGGGFSSSQLGSALIGNMPQQQNILGRIINPSNYPYVGSGSITTAFWMSGAKTSGNIVEAGWFYRPASLDNIGSAANDHTVGIKITDGNGIQVRTSVRDLPYDRLTSIDLWWGGTTHYGTPTGGNSWTWRTPNEYWAWNEEWPEVTIPHDDVAFFMVRSEFVASGVETGVPNHMKVWLSVDGQPWIFIGSGVTGPPASSIFSSSNPRNRHAEDAVGLKVQAINNDFLGESLSVNEIVLWTDSDKLDSDELNTFYNIVSTYFRPLDEYKPTIVPTDTYIHRTIGPFTLPPFAKSEIFNPGEIGSGLLVTLEVGIGDYGKDASAYLLEETPPSGFIIRNIHPGFDVRYVGQNSRPNTQQQIFHDPQSGIMQPYDEILGVNTYGASIRWINHDNHPQKDERRLPTPISIYTYELYPFTQDSAPTVEEFVFSGSGLFFNGTNNHGTFPIETTIDISGTASGVLGGLKSSAFNLFTSGPMQSSGAVNLYIRTEEKFTSAFIGNAPRTPEATDFIFEADGEAAIESLAGFEYGPSLYIKGPLLYDNNISLVLFGPAGDEKTLFTHGSDFFTSSGDFPSGMLLKTGNGHEVASGSMNLFAIGPIPFSGETTLYTQAGSFDDKTLFTHGHLPKNKVASGYIKGPEFIITSGDFTYPLDETLFLFPSGGNSPDAYIKGPEFIISSGTFPYPGDPSLFTTPYGDQSPDLYMQAHIDVSGNVPLWIGPLRQKTSWTLYLKSVSNTISGTSNLFIHGFIGASGVNQSFNEMPFFLEAVNADFPYTVGGTEEWTLFVKAQSGNITNNEDWSLFLKADTTTTGVSPLFTFGHASGQPPRGNEINDSVNMVCSVDPDDLSRIGFTPYDSQDDPWTLFIKGNPGYFGITNLYMSGSIPIPLVASGNLFIEGLFEQETATATLYLFGISGITNNGPNGVSLFMNVGAQVYNNKANLYSHGF